MLNSISGEVRSNIQVWDSQVQSVKLANNSEIMRITNAISTLEAKISAGLTNNNVTATQQTAVVRTTAVGQTESVGCTVGSDTSDQGVNGVNACNISTYSNSVNISNPSVNSCSDNVNVFIIQKRAIRILLRLGPWISCREGFKKLDILTVSCLYIYALMLFAVKDINIYRTNSSVHGMNTRQQINYIYLW